MWHGRNFAWLNWLSEFIQEEVEEEMLGPGLGLAAPKTIPPKNVQIWGIRKDTGLLYSFYKNLVTDKVVFNSWRDYSKEELTVDKIASEYYGTCGENAKPENVGKRYRAWKLADGTFVNGTFEILKDDDNSNVDCAVEGCTTHV